MICFAVNCLAMTRGRSALVSALFFSVTAFVCSAAGAQQPARTPDMYFAPTRQAVADALRILGKSLLAHLDYEERNLQTTVLRLRDFGQAAETGALDGAT